MKKLNDWFFGPQSAATLGIFRILACGLCFLNLITIGVIFEAFYSTKGFYPLEFLERWGGNLPRLNLLAGVADDRVAWALYLVCVVAALLSTLGLFTRASLVVLFVTLISLYHRSPDHLNSGDTLIRQWIFILLIAPSGQAFSLDKLIAKRKGQDWQIPQISSWPLRLIQIQLAVVYGTTVWHKVYGETWWNGTATFTSSHLSELQRFPLPSWWDAMPAVAMQTYGTLVIEVALATLVFFKPCRKWVLLGGLMLHAGIEYSMNIPLFAFIICSGYLAFYKGEEVEGFLARLGQKFPFLAKLLPSVHPEQA